MSDNLRVAVGQASQRGPKKKNEDFYGVLTPNPPQLQLKGITAVIADGMSGGGEGREASEYTVKGLLSDYYSTPDSWSVQTSVEKVLGAINSWLFGQSVTRHGTPGALGTTLGVAVLKSSTAHLFHVGDSRIYRFQEGRLERLTRDHRVVLSDGRNYLNRAMGIEPRIQVDYRRVAMEPGDLLVFTTDGVHDFLADQGIAERLRKAQGDLDLVAGEIVAAALASGGNDNTTCQLVRIDALPLELPDEFYQKLTELPFPPELEPGMVLDGYRIEEEIHASKRSQLYRVLDMESGQHFVLKTPSVNYEDDPEYIDQFIMEEWVGRRIRNPHVLQVCPTRRRQHFLYHVTELVEGATLRRWIDDHPQPDIETVYDIVDQITQGLRAFHRLEMVHRDLKPENIMIDARGVVKIVDFGSVKVAGIDEIARPLDPMALVGTVNYTAPEYHAGSAGSKSSDLFALGVIAYELYTGGAHPYREKIPTRPVGCRGHYSPAYHHNPMLPPWLDGALEKAVRCNPADRYDSLSEFLFDLSHPNPHFMRNTPLPLLERNPLAFWRTTAIALFVLSLSLFLLLISR